MNHTRLSRRHIVFFAVALTVSLVWGAFSLSEPKSLIRLQPAAPNAEAPAPAVDADGAMTWPLGVAP